MTGVGLAAAGAGLVASEDGADLTSAALVSDLEFAAVAEGTEEGLEVGVFSLPAATRSRYLHTTSQHTRTCTHLVDVFWEGTYICVHRCKHKIQPDA